MTPTLCVTSSEVELAVYTWGRPGTKARPKPTVVLVHGYPDSANIWQRIAEGLAERFYVVAYDVRGAGHSSRPAHTQAYALAHLMADLSAVVDRISPHQAVHLVCHDWGSIQCWEAFATPSLHERITSYTSISGPSLDHAGHWLRKRLSSGSPKMLAQVARQLARSWYMFAFQLPALAPAAWRLGLGRRWPRLLEKTEGIRGIAESPTQTEDGLHGIHLYRANLIARLRKPQLRRTDLPVQLIVPTRDRYMIPEIWDDLTQWVPNLWRREADAGHWILLSHPESIASWVSEFIRFVEGGRPSAALRRARVRPESAIGFKRA